MKKKEDIWHRSQTRRSKSTCWIELDKIPCGSERRIRREKDPGSGLTVGPSTSQVGSQENLLSRQQRTVSNSTRPTKITKDGMALTAVNHLTLFAQEQFAQVNNKGSNMRRLDDSSFVQHHQEIQECSVPTMDPTARLPASSLVLLDGREREIAATSGAMTGMIGRIGSMLRRLARGMVVISPQLQINTSTTI